MNPCPFCSKKFTHKSLKRHVQAHEKNSRLDKLHVATYKNNENKEVIDWAVDYFTSKKREKPIDKIERKDPACAMCGKSFSYGHKKRHEQDCPFIKPQREIKDIVDKEQQSEKFNNLLDKEIREAELKLSKDSLSKRIDQAVKKQMLLMNLVEYNTESAHIDQSLPDIMLLEENKEAEKEEEQWLTRVHDEFDRVPPNGIVYGRAEQVNSILQFLNE